MQLGKKSYLVNNYPTYPCDRCPPLPFPSFPGCPSLPPSVTCSCCFTGWLLCSVFRSHALIHDDIVNRHNTLETWSREKTLWILRFARSTIVIKGSDCSLRKGSLTPLFFPSLLSPSSEKIGLADDRHSPSLSLSFCPFIVFSSPFFFFLFFTLFSLTSLLLHHPFDTNADQRRSILVRHPGLGMYFCLKVVSHVNKM